MSLFGSVISSIIYDIGIFMNRLQNKVVLITGTTSIMGRVCAIAVNPLQMVVCQA